MYSFAGSCAAFRRIGLALFFSQLTLFIYGFPPFHFGIWVQVEPVQLMMFVFSYLTCAWLMLGIAKNWLVSRANTPLWWMILAWVVWQLMILPFASTPWRSWFGPPELGEGVALHVCGLLMIMLAYPLLEVAKYRRWLLLTSIVLLLAQCGLHILNVLNGFTDDMKFDSDRWVPTLHPKDLAFAVAYVWIAIMSWHLPKKNVAYTGFVLFFVAAIWAAQNRTAQVVLLSMLMFTLLVQAITNAGYLRRLLYPSRTWRVILMAGCLVPMLWVVLAINFGTMQYVIYGDDAMKLTRDRDSGFYLYNRDGAIGGRIPFLQVAWDVIEHEPQRLIAGDGWGRFTDDIYKYALVDGVYVYHDGKRSPNWSALEDVPIVHAHCQPIEALLSLGLPGMLLWLAIPMLAIWFMPRKHFWNCAPMIVGLVALSYFWFELIQDLPYRALMLASLCRFSTKRMRWNLQGKPAVIIILLSLACMALGWSAWQQREAIMYSQRLRYAMVTTNPKDFPIEWLREDTKRGGDRLRQIALLQELALARTLHVQPPDNIDLAWYVLFLNATHEYALTPNSNARAASTELWLTYKLFSELNVPVFSSLQWAVLPAVPKNILLIARKAPLRDDVAATYLMNLNKLTKGDVKEQTAFLEELLSINPNHRGALWTYGQLLLTASGREEEGRAMMKKAVSLGLKDVFPVLPEQLAPYK